MTRLLGALFVLILGWFGFMSTAEAAIAEPTPSIVHAHEYDGHQDSPEATLAITGRGPPSRAYGHTTYDAVDRWSHGASPRSGRDATPTAYTYNDLAEVVRVAKTAVASSEVSRGVQRTNERAMRSHVAANAGARMADGLIGVPQAPMSRALARLQGLRLGDKNIVQGVDAFGSRAGSTFRGRGPTAGSDLDLLVRIDPTALGGRSGPWIQRTLRSIADEFEAEAEVPLSIHAPGNIGMFEKSIPGATFVPLG